MSSLVLNLLNRAGGPNVRGTVIPVDLPVYSVYDFLTIACNKPEKSSYANTTFFRLTQDDSEFKEELLTLCKYVKFPGKGQRETPCMTIRGLQRLLMILGGKVAAEFREIIEGTFTRVMAGDQSLIEVINANAESQGPVQQAYRAGLAQEPVAPGLDEFCLGRKREREDRLFDMEMQERQQKLEEARLERIHKSALHEQSLAEKRLEQVQKSATFLQSLKGMAGVDERTKMQLEDYTKNVLFNKLAVVVTGTGGGSGGSGVPVDEPSHAINVSVVAGEMGYKLTDAQMQRVGREMAKRYREAYKRDPPKHKQFVGGNFIPVNSYMERDRGMMEDAIRMLE